MFRLILTDLDDTLLRSDKTLSARTAYVLHRCRAAGMLVGFSTARGESNILRFTDLLQPDAVISSGGALVRFRGEIVHSTLFTESETRALIDEGLRLGCEVTVDALSGHYWNYRIDPRRADASWGDAIHTDFSAFAEPSLKVCIELPDESQAARIASCVPACDWLRFSGGDWYKFTPTGATKEGAILALCAHLSLSSACVVAFGDDTGDIGMLKLCGRGVAVANAVPAVKQIADAVTESNDRDGVAVYLEKYLLNQP